MMHPVSGAAVSPPTHRAETKDDLVTYNGRTAKTSRMCGHARLGAKGTTMRLGSRGTRYSPIRQECGRALTESRRLTGPAGDIMLAARALFEERGVAKTTIKDVASEAGVARELVYYYFENKQAVIDAVLDDYVEDLVESVIVWNESRRFGDTEGSLRACVATFRRALYDANGLRPMIRVLEELGVRDAFDVRAVRETVDCINDNIVAEYAAYHHVEIDMVYEMFCVVIFGLVGLVKINPKISDEALMKVVEQTLRLDMEPLEPPDSQSAADERCIKRDISTPQRC